MLSNLRARIKSLNIAEKLLFFSSFSLALSTLLPWYSDIDKFNEGLTYIAITGPLYLAGFFILTLSILSITYIFVKADFKIIPLNKANIFILTASISALMILLISSAYFHPKFGINVVTRQAGIGMLLATMSVVVMTVGIVLSKNLNKNSFRNLDVHAESLDTIIPEDTRKKVSNLKLPQGSEDLRSERFSYFSGSGYNNN